MNPVISRLLRPPRIEPGKTYPVVLFLHGAGERGTDNEQQLAYLPTWLAEPAMQEKYPCYLVAAQCRPDHRWVEVAWDGVGEHAAGAADDRRSRRSRCGAR